MLAKLDIPPDVAARLKVSVMNVTPDQAAIWMARGGKNRKFKNSLADKYGADMRAGRWKFNGESIILSDAEGGGKVLDGQHRLTGIIESGTTQTFLVIEGLPEDVFETIDIGRTRSFADSLSAEGLAHSTQLSAIAAGAYRYIAGIPGGKAISTAVLFPFVKAHPYVTEVAHMPSKLWKLVPGSAMGAVIFLANESRKHNDLVLEFTYGVMEGIALAKDDPRYALREWAIHERGLRRGELRGLFALSATIQAWNAWATEKSLRTIRGMDKAPTRWRYPIAGFEPEAFPDVPQLIEPEA